MKVICRISLVVLPSLLIFGQQFEVASIKPAAQTAQDQTSAGLNVDPAMVRYSALSLKLYLGMAYNLMNYQISAPDWMTAERWDITAKLPDGSSPAQVPQMLQALLRDRFQMKMHRETKELPVYALVIGKRELKLRGSPPDPAAGTDPQERSVVAASGSGRTVVTYGNGSYFIVGTNRFEGKRLSMELVAGTLSRFADRPVVDMTDLKGNYDFTMEFSAEDFRAMMMRAAIAQGSVVPAEALKLLDTSSGDTLFSAVEELGLKLEPRRAPIEMLVIDQALRMPTAN
jgi:uncharacterized protein (TIGR03435 family)